MIKPNRDPSVLEELSKNPLETRITVNKKEAWQIRLSPELLEKYNENGSISGDERKVDLSKNHNSILSKIQEERRKSKMFWEGEADKPHDWRAALRASGHPTSL